MKELWASLVYVQGPSANFILYLEPGFESKRTVKSTGFPPLQDVTEVDWTKVIPCGQAGTQIKFLLICRNYHSVICVLARQNQTTRAGQNMRASGLVRFSIWQASTAFADDLAER